MKLPRFVVFTLSTALWATVLGDYMLLNSTDARIMSRVKRIVTKSTSRAAKERVIVGATVERANDLRLHLVLLLTLLAEHGGFSSFSRSNTNWTEHDVKLANHLVKTFHMLGSSGFKPPRTNKRLPSNDEERLRSFMNACYMMFNDKSPTFLLMKKMRSPGRKLTPEDEEAYLRDLTSLLYVMASGGDALKLMSSLSSPDGGQLSPQQQQLATDYTILLSQADGPKLPFRGCGENGDSNAARQSDWPWMAALMSTQFNFLRLFCGGVLINEWFVLTAAHCLNDKRPWEIIVRLGEYNFRQPNAWRRNHQVERMFLHERFDPQTYDHDIALIKLKEKVAVRDSVAQIWPICLPPPAIDLDNKNAFVAGWGKISQGGPASEVLLDADLPIWRKYECERLFQVRGDPINYNLQFCAGPKDGSADACDGDSGGPLMLKMPSGRWAVVGIVSWGIDGKCAVPGEPGVYTRVSAYTNWIYSKISF